MPASLSEVLHVVPYKLCELQNQHLEAVTKQRLGRAIVMVCIYVCMYVCMHIPVYHYIYIYIYIYYEYINI